MYISQILVASALGTVVKAVGSVRVIPMVASGGALLGFFTACFLVIYPTPNSQWENASTLYTLVTFVCSFPISYLRIFFLNIMCWQRGRLRQNFWKTGLDAGKSHQQRSGCDDRKTQLPETHQGGQSHVYNHFLSHRERVSAVTGWMSWQIAAEVFKS